MKYYYLSYSLYSLYSYFHRVSGGYYVYNPTFHSSLLGTGFIILLTSILLLFIFGEIRNITSLVLLNNNGFLLSFFFYIILCFLWIGNLLMCILLSLFYDGFIFSFFTSIIEEHCWFWLPRILHERREKEEEFS